MFLSLLFFLSVSSAPLQGITTTPPSEINFLAGETQVIKSETCQSTQIRNFDLLDLEGHKVNKLIYLQTKSILQSSRADGVKMELNSTFRSCAEQVSLRGSNCASTSLLAESCNPPTEKPGDSLHNYGMAIDFKCSDSPIFEKSSCYTWLKQNASKYKFQQRAEEPWHWSMTGK